LRILTTAKSVFDTELNVSLDKGKIVKEKMQFVMNPWDENAIEAAVQFKENSDAETTLVSIGDENSIAVIRRGFAMGIDFGIHIHETVLDDATADILALILEKVYRKKNYDLILAGKQSQDTDNGQVGIMLAEIVGIPCVSNVIKIDQMDQECLEVTRLGDSGLEIYEVQLPALLTVNDSINEPRLVGVRGVLNAKKKNITTLNLSDLDLTAEAIGIETPKIKIVESVFQKSEKSTKKFEGDPAEITEKVVSLLVEETGVI
jgi:electron transfer flavoprotein beta subunit